MVPDPFPVQIGDSFLAHELPVGHKAFYALFSEQAHKTLDKVYPFLAVGVPPLVEHGEEQRKSHPLVHQVNDRIKNGANPSVQVDGEHKDGTAKWHLTYTETSNPLNHKIYQQFKPIDIAALLQLVDEHTDFLSAFTHLLGSNVHQGTNKQQLIACLVAFGTNYGIGRMSGISDMSYQDLMTTAGSLIHLTSLKHVGLVYVGFTENDPKKIILDEDGSRIYLPKMNNIQLAKPRSIAKSVLRMVEKRTDKITLTNLGLLANFMIRHFPALSDWILLTNRKKNQGAVY